MCAYARRQSSTRYRIIIAVVVAVIIGRESKLLRLFLFFFFLNAASAKRAAVGRPLTKAENDVRNGKQKRPFQNHRNKNIVKHASDTASTDLNSAESVSDAGPIMDARRGALEGAQRYQISD